MIFEYKNDVEVFIDKVKSWLDFKLDNEPLNCTITYNPSKGEEFNVEVFSEYIKQATALCEGIDIKLEYVIPNYIELDEDFLANLLDNYEYIQTNLNTSMNLVVDGLNVPIDTFISSARKLESVVSMVKNANNNGEPLSVFERLMLIYDYVSENVYEESEEDIMESRNWVHILNKNKITCRGYHTLLSEICGRIFTPEELVVLHSSSIVKDLEKQPIGGHCSSLIYINDPKYNIYGLMHGDACWDCKKDDEKTITYCCIPVGDMLHIKCLFNFDSDILKMYMSTKSEYTFDIDESEIHLSEIDWLKSLTPEYINDFKKIEFLLPELLPYSNRPFDFFSSVPSEEVEDMNNKTDIDNYLLVQQYIIDIINQTRSPSIYAYISALEIVARNKGLNEDEIEEYINNIINNSYNKTQKVFYVEGCKSPFASENRVTYADFKNCIGQTISR